MINAASLEAIKKAKFSKNFIKPLYDSYCFSNIPQTVKNLLLDEKKPALPLDVFGSLPQSYDKVIVFVIDSFGWKFFEKYSEKYSFLQHIKKNAVVSKLTTQYPPTTAAEMTTLHTGLAVGQSGVYEWFYYEPLVDAVIAPLLFSFAGKRVRDNLLATGIEPKKFFPIQTIYKDLQKNGIPSYVFQDAEYAYSPYSQVIFEGAGVSPYSTLSEAITNLTEKTLNDSGKGYYFLYFDKIDKKAHRYGSHTQQFESEVDVLFYTLEKLLKNLQGKLKNTLFIMTADHGHADIDPATTIYLNEHYPKVKQWMKTSKNGEPIVAAGSCRNMYLHIKEDNLDEAQKFLQQELNGKGEVYKVVDLIKQNFYASSSVELSKTFLDRVGNLVILCYSNQSVWWYEKDKFEIKYHGHHGSMTPDEMETIFACLPL